MGLLQNKAVDQDPLCWLEFTKDAILTSCKAGHVRTWTRPATGSASPEPHSVVSSEKGDL